MSLDEALDSLTPETSPLTFRAFLTTPRNAADAPAEPMARRIDGELRRVDGSPAVVGRVAIWSAPHWFPLAIFPLVQSVGDSSVTLVFDHEHLGDLDRTSVSGELLAGATSLDRRHPRRADGDREPRAPGRDPDSERPDAAHHRARPEYSLVGDLDGRERSGRGCPRCLRSPGSRPGLKYPVSSVIGTACPTPLRRSSAKDAIIAWKDRAEVLTLVNRLPTGIVFVHHGREESSDGGAFASAPRSACLSGCVARGCASRVGRLLCGRHQSPDRSKVPRCTARGPGQRPSDRRPAPEWSVLHTAESRKRKQGVETCQKDRSVARLGIFSGKINVRLLDRHPYETRRAFSC